ncbi:MAG: hypothetical protein LBR32_06205 [Propionibacteriaceae bacterium]|jgi:predicted unusual protein kinase regulating ubiquinone biosynthesis (AarF/ABC1/UbiB family)|nr:hypothetical protein [Propionibacteriaceae bacterium]
MTSAPPSPQHKALLDKRYRTTVGLALRFSAELWWASKTAWLRSPERQQERLRALYTRQAVQFRRFATEMGGGIVKLGQFLSVRIDALPKQYTDELGKLQDAVPAVDTPTIIARVEAELGRPVGEVFAEFDRLPLAAASLGQVHQARLVSGEAVAVKILRPGVEELVETDIRSLRLVLRLLDRFTSLGRWMDAKAFADDFANTFRDELDYRKEGANAETFQRNFLLSPHVEMPKIHWDCSSQRVLTMEFMDGVKIDDLAVIDALGVDRAALAANFLELYLKMFLADGFYHADPHPGNVFVRPDGVIQLIDFGQVGSLPDAMREQFARLLVAVFSHDADGMVDSLRQLGFLGRDADVSRLKDKLSDIVDAMIGEVGTMFSGESYLDQLMSGRRPMDSFHVDAALLDELQELIFSQPIQLPGNVSFLGKALITALANAYRLDPGIDLVAVVEPYVRTFAAPSGFDDLVAMALSDGADFLRKLPATARRLVTLAEKLDNGQLEVGLAPAQLRRLERLERANTRQMVTTVAASAAALAGWLAYLLRRRR